MAFWFIDLLIKFDHQYLSMKTKNILKFHLFTIVLFCSSCSKFIGPAMTGPNNISYLPRPFILDSTNQETYISGQLSLNSTKNDYTSFGLGSLNISHAYANKNINASIGGFGFAGIVNFAYLNDANTNQNFTDFQKSLFGFGLRSTIGFHIITTNKKVNFRILNWENAYSQEFGSYAKYRELLQSTASQNNIYSNTYYISTFTKVFTTGFSSEILINEPFDNKDFTFGFRGFAGFSPLLGSSFKNKSNDNLEYSLGSFVLSSSLFFNIKKTILIAEIGMGDKSYGAKIGIGKKF